MTKVIHKLQLFPGQTYGTFLFPKEAKVVGADFQGPFISIWFLTDPQTPASMQYDFRIVGTGEQYDDDWEYLAGPILSQDAQFVFHLIGKPNT